MNELDTTFLAVQRVMDFSQASNRAIAQNLANLNTSNYRRCIVSFDVLLEAARIGDRRRRLERLENLRPEVTVDEQSTPGPNGNNVSAERELSLLQRQALIHEFAAQMASGKLQGLRLAISGRG